MDKLWSDGCVATDGMPRVVTRLQAVTILFAKSVRPYRRNTPRLGGNTKHIPERRKVEMIFGGPREIRSGRIVPDECT